MIRTFDRYAPKARNPVYLVFSFAMIILFVVGMNALRRNRQWLPFLSFPAVCSDVHGAVYTFTY